MVNNSHIKNKIAAFLFRNKINMVVYAFLLASIFFFVYESVILVNSLDEAGLISDMRTYLDGAAALDKWNFYVPIGYPVFLFLVFKFVPFSALNAYYANIFLSVVSALLLFFIGKKISGIWAGLIAAIFFIFSHETYVLVSLVLAEQLQLVLYLSLVLILVHFLSERKSIWLAVLLSVILAATLLTKSSIYFLIVPFFLIIPLKGFNTIVTYLRNYWISIVIFLAIVVSYGVYNQKVFGKFVIVSSNGSAVFYSGNNPGADGLNAGSRKPIPPYLLTGVTTIEKNDNENKLYSKLGWEFRKRYPLSVKQLSENRAMAWGGIIPEQDDNFRLIKRTFDANPGLFMIPRSVTMIGGILAFFISMILVCLLNLEKLKNVKGKNVDLSLMIYAAVFALMSIIVSLLISPRPQFAIHQISLAFCVVMIFYTIRLARTENYLFLSRLLLAVGIILFASVHILFFLVKVRYRYPMTAFLCLMIGFAFNDFLNFVKSFYFEKTSLVFKPLGETFINKAKKIKTKR